MVMWSIECGTIVSTLTVANYVILLNIHLCQTYLFRDVVQSKLENLGQVNCCH